MTQTTMGQVGDLVRGTHPYCFKSGEWGLIVGMDTVNERPCWVVSWPDGAVDDFVIGDPVAGYEFRER